MVKLTEFALEFPSKVELSTQFPNSSSSSSLSLQLTVIKDINAVINRTLLLFIKFVFLIVFNLFICLIIAQT